MAEEEKIREYAKLALQDLTDESKNWKDRIKDFLWEVFIILVAVNITLWFHNWNDKRHEKKEMSLYLNTIKMELKANAENFEYYAKWLQKSANYANYLKLNAKKPLNKDSLNYYAVTTDKGCGYMNINSLTTAYFTSYAFEMFKNSAIMSKFSDTELLKSIWEAYTVVEYARVMIDNNFKIKSEEAMKEQQLTAEGQIVAIPMRSFYSTDLVPQMIGQCEGASQIIKEIVSKLEKSKILQ